MFTIGNEGSFKTLYLLSRQSNEGYIRHEGILLHPPWALGGIGQGSGMGMR